jgi:hypothetical protein
MSAKIYDYRRIITALGVVLALLAMSVPVWAGAIQIPKGTEVKLKFSPGMKISSGDVKPGVPLVCYLQEPIEIGGVTVVEKDAQATAKVAEVKPAGKGGKPGYIKIEFESLDAKGEFKLVNADKIKISGAIESKGKGKKLLSYLFIFGLFIKGSQGAIPTDQVYTAKVAESVLVDNGK